MSTPNRKLVSKSLIHKKIEFLNAKQPTNFTLQSLLMDALAAIPRALERSQEINESSSFKRVIGSHKSDQSILLGQVLLYEDGTDIMFLIENPETAELEIDHQEVSADPQGRKKEVLQGALYFGVFGNDLAVLQSQSVNFHSLENHFNWFLKDRTSVLNSDYSIVLTNQPTENMEQAIQAGNFKAFSVGSPISGVDSDNEKNVTDTSSISTKMKGNINLFKHVLKDLWKDELNLSEDIDDANLELFIQLKYKRTTSESGQKFLDSLARATRHFDPKDTVIKTKEGKTIQGDELRLSTKLSVESINGVLDRSDVYAKLVRWIQELNDRGYLG